MSDIDFIKTDILIIGSGLAGLRCGISALEENPGVSVLIVTKGFGPVGSSFTNINNALGMQVCLNSDEIECFVKDAVSIASPGLIDSELTKIMAEESEECFHFLKNLKIRFNRDENGNFIRYPGCFCTDSNRAFIFRNLAESFHHLKNKYISLSGKYLGNHSAIHLIKGAGTDEKSVCGGVFISEKTGRYFVIGALSTIVASGGTTPLFKWNVGGRFLTGYSPALLKMAGAKIINERYHQFIWHHAKTYQPVSPCEYLMSGASIRFKNKIIAEIPEEILSLFPKRVTHVPAAYDFPDSAIDRFLLNYADDKGIVTFILQDKKEVPVVLCAHAWNGGSKIDTNAWTGVPGLYACGECAGGMHGANRLGGAMVLSTQVFGKRAGINSVRNLGNFFFATRAQYMARAQEIINTAISPVDNAYINHLKNHIYMNAINHLCDFKNNSSANIEIENSNIKKAKGLSNRLLLESTLALNFAPEPK